MIRFIRLAFLACVAVTLITVALANRGFVAVRLIPEELANLFSLSASIQLPLFIVIFASILVGLLIGFVWEYLREFKIRREVGKKEKQVHKLEKEVETLRKKTGDGKDDVLALIE